MFIKLSVDGTPILVNMGTVAEAHTRRKGGSTLYFNFSVGEDSEQSECWVDQTLDQVLELTQK